MPVAGKLASSNGLWLAPANNTNRGHLDMATTSIFLRLFLVSLIYIAFTGVNELSAAQSWYFEWSCINVKGCADNGIPASKREGPYSSASECNSFRNRMTSARGFRVQSCTSVDSPTQPRRTQPTREQAPTAADMAPARTVTVPDGKELNFYCGATHGVLRGSTREWYLGCCPRSHPILKSLSPTVQCGTEEARKIGLDCKCYKKVEFCMRDQDHVGMCY